MMRQCLRARSHLAIGALLREGILAEACVPARAYSIVSAVIRRRWESLAVCGLLELYRPGGCWRRGRMGAGLVGLGRALLRWLHRQLARGLSGGLLAERLLRQQPALRWLSLAPRVRPAPGVGGRAAWRLRLPRVLLSLALLRRCGCRRRLDRRPVQLLLPRVGVPRVAGRRGRLGDASAVGIGPASAIHHHLLDAREELLRGLDAGLDGAQQGAKRLVVAWQVPNLNLCAGHLLNVPDLGVR
mmetsp:Transcript_106377/g.343152  ORF Transcript_106377/g.343152 Transcript_106377/m.343152 type:complete len:243 (+) Transcript_106377:464-1192(+)